VQQTTIWKSGRDWLAGAQGAPAVGSQARPDLTRVKSGKKTGECYKYHAWLVASLLAGFAVGDR
jgi:hypothetical protein